MSQHISHTSRKLSASSPTSQCLCQSFAKECACPTLKEKLKISFPSENKQYTNPQADSARKSNLPISRNLNIDNGLRGQRKGRQLVTGGILYCRASASFNVSASNKLLCNLTGQCFEIGNKNIPPIRSSIKKNSKYRKIPRPFKVPGDLVRFGQVYATVMALPLQ